MLTILIADDDNTTRLLLEAALPDHLSSNHAPLIIHTARDGSEAWDTFRSTTVDIVIADLLMPRMDGFDLCDAIRRDKSGKATPIFVTSAVYRKPSLLADLIRQHDVTFVPKPVNPVDLARQIEEALATE